VPTGSRANADFHKPFAHFVHQVTLFWRDKRISDVIRERAYDPRSGSIAIVRRAGPSAYLRRARAAGIDKTIVMPAFHTDNWLANREVARLIARNPSRLIGFAFVHAKRDAERVFRVVRTP
jgi:predicted TIM-barrel fold metal-dependent hydrolase